MTGDDESFEAGVGGWWNQTNCTVAQSTLQAFSGTGSLEVTSLASGGVAASGPNTLGVTAGQTYKASVWVRTAAAGLFFYLQVDWKDAAFAFLSNVFTTPVVVQTNVWTNLALTATAPALATMGTPIVGTTATGVQVYYVDQAFLGKNVGLVVQTGQAVNRSAFW